MTPWHIFVMVNFSAWQVPGAGETSNRLTGNSNQHDKWMSMNFFQTAS